MKRFLKKAAMLSAVALMAQLLLLPGMAMAESTQPTDVSIDSTAGTDVLASEVQQEAPTTEAVPEETAGETEKTAERKVKMSDEELAAWYANSPLVQQALVNGFAGGEPQE